ncbi:alpha/beta hydrolase fold domain-containing protein [Nocardia sp. NPDC049737]|uniref:alpha/beta hydrolase fold domain-containing protein n=1 Tax=Nocardia sp. NPDC049737 TaxID=3154358 RepID=UPI00342CE731
MSSQSDESLSVAPTTLPTTPDAIELRHLRAFVTVAEELNFGRAAARLYVSQPALSRQIRALERLIGCDLLRRTTHQVELTLAGEALLDRARRILEGVDEAVVATRAVGGELLAHITRYWELLGAADAELHAMRTAYEDLHAQFPAPPEISIRPITAGGVSSLLLTPARPDAGTVLYLHGGGYIAGSAFGYRALAGALTAAANTTTLVLDYRLAPEHPYPAAVEDALRGYRWLLETGTDPGRITLTGDSIGAHLILCTLLRIREEQLPMPAAAVLLCPGIDLHCPEPSESEPAPEPAQARFHQRIIGDYLAGHSDDNPFVAPLLADLTGLPPMLIQASTGDNHLTDAHRLTDHARAHDVAISLELYPVDTHNFHIFWPFLPEAADALRAAGRFIQDHTVDIHAHPRVRPSA